MNENINAIFFDNDGILVDTEKLYFEATRRIFAKIGIELTTEMYIEYFLVNSHGTWHLAKAMGHSELRISELRTERNNIYSKLLAEEMQIIPGAEETVKKLHGRYKLGIVTSSRRDHFDIIHSKTGLLKYFDFALTSDDFKNTKPDPEPYLKALEKSGRGKEECLVIEDSLRGLTAARKAGLKCCVIPTGLTKFSDFSDADFILDNISDLPRILDGMK